MNDYDISDCFVPIPDKSDLDNLDGLDSGSEYETCIPFSYYGCGDAKGKDCKTVRKKQLQDDESGLTMLQKRNQKLLTRPAATTPHPEENPGFVPPSSTVPSDCCHHNEPGGRRKFVISFGANNASLGNECLITERNRCQDFWKFIDSHPDLLALISDGEFVHSSPPHLMRASAPSQQRQMLSKRKNAEILKARNKEIHDAERERKLKRKMALEELQRKSGQVPFVRKSPGLKDSSNAKERSMKANSTNDCFKDVLREMELFDKACGNPVSLAGGSENSKPLNNYEDTEDAEEYVNRRSLDIDNEQGVE